MISPRRTTILCAPLLAIAGCGSGGLEGPPIERWIDSPEQLRVVTSAPVPSTAARAYHWTGEEIATWARRESEDRVTLISPELDFRSLLEIDCICVRVADFRGRDRMTLHWNDAIEFEGGDDTRQRRELTARGGAKGGVFVIHGDDISDVDLLGTAEEENAPRFLFLRFPAADDGDVLFETASVLGVDAALSGKSSGWTRKTVAGEIRDAFFVTTPAAVEVELDLRSGGELAFGVQSPVPGEVIQLGLTVAGRLHRARVEAIGGWSDVRLKIPPTEAKSLTLGVESALPGRTVFLGNPMLLRPRPDDDQPNVILYVMDALRAEQTSLYGYPRETTPFLEELAADGVVFENAYSPVSWTKPSVVTLLTSLYPQVHGVGERSYSDVLPENVATLQDVLRGGGYVTSSFSANPLACTLSNLDQGFDQTFTPNSFEIEGRQVKQNKIHSDDLNAKILPWLETHARDRFFLYVHTVDPHVPFAAPVTPPELVGDGTSIDRYDAEIRFNDGQIERLVEKLTELGILENTLLIVTSDHGEAFGEHGTTGHGTSVYQEEVRIPLLFHHRGFLARRRVEQPVQLIDLMPTIVSYLGIDPASVPMQGRDLLDEEAERDLAPVFLSRFVYPKDVETARFSEVEYHAVVEGEWKLIAAERGERQVFDVELYHLGDDPSEREDRKEQDPERARRAHDRLRGFLQQQTARRVTYTSNLEGGSGSGESAVSEEVLEQLRVLGYVE